MHRLQWAPLNAGVFLIILGSVILLSLLAILNAFQALSLTFTVFGLWLVIAGLVFPPSSNPYGTPRMMIVGWGGLVTILGVIGLVGATAGALLPIVFAVLLVLAGIGAIGYSLTRAESKSSTDRSPRP